MTAPEAILLATGVRPCDGTLVRRAVDRPVTAVLAGSSFRGSRGLGGNRDPTQVFILSKLSTCCASIR
jgi:hypothetical protein